MPLLPTFMIAHCRRGNSEIGQLRTQHQTDVGDCENIKWPTTWCCVNVPMSSKRDVDNYEGTWCSRVVLEVLRQAARKGSGFNVIVTEGRPDNTGLTMARALDAAGIPATLVLDSGAAYCLDRCATSCSVCRPLKAQACCIHFFPLVRLPCKTDPVTWSGGISLTRWSLAVVGPGCTG